MWSTNFSSFPKLQIYEKKTVDQFRNNNSSTQYTPPPPLRTSPETYFYQKKLRFVSFCQFYSKKKILATFWKKSFFHGIWARYDIGDFTSRAAKGLKGHSSRHVIARFSLKTFGRIWKPTSANLSSLLSSVPNIWQFSFLLRKAFLS